MADTGAMIVERGMGPSFDVLTGGQGLAVPLTNRSGGDPLAVTPALPSGRDPNADYAVDPTPSAQGSVDYSAYGLAKPPPEPSLMPAGGQYSTPYYAAYTNDGDLAGAVMVDEGQKVRMVDPSTGDVIYEGTGPEGARMATQIANAVSQEKGRTAAWQIQKGDAQGSNWQTMAAERYDPKKQGFLGKLADIALPILGALLMPVTGGLSATLAAGLGAAGGSALSSLAQGRSLSDTLVRAALSGAGAGVGAGALGALGGSAAGSAAGGAAGGAGGAGASAAEAAWLAALPGAVAPAVVTAAGSGLGGALGAGVGSAAGGALQGSSGSNSLQGSQGSDTIGTRVDPLVVTAERAARSGLGVDQMVALGIPAAVATAALATVGGATAPGGNYVDPLTVTANPLPEPVGPEVVLPGAAAVGTVAGLTQSPAGPEDKNALQKALDLAKGNPQLVAALLAAATGGASGSGNGNYSVTTGPGTRSSLSPVFSAQLPASTLAVRTPRDMTGTDWAHYGMGPEKSFFTSVPQRFAVGGRAVRGAGTGRSDSIPARLSDGEYVVDAETVALLGDGSSKAGADKLDRFRVAVRKQKGRDLAKGRFSVAAKEPHAYLGGRV